MKYSIFTIVFLAFLVFTSDTQAQNRRRFPPKAKNLIAAQSSNNAVIVDERLAVLRVEPSFFSKAVMRMQNGRKISIIGSKEADGVTFYRVTALPNNYGWVQAEAIVGKFRRGDDARLAKLVQSSDGFEQIERTHIFLETFPDSSLRPAILLLMGDLMEETALRLSNEAARRLNRREMAASGAPLHSFYLNYISLDRYRRQGINFVFNSSTKLLHYDGASWREITKKFPKSTEALEAQKRLDSLKEKMEAVK
ncbi:MAG: SH3 domain-containing protein [Acidobacteriota bacterium]|nr:SH3 domain-containing protein [Acidobacteriota bacterium]